MLARPFMSVAVLPVAVSRRGALRPIAVAVGLLALLALLIGTAVPAAAGRPVIYAQDDAYIHLAIAKSVAAHGVWGINADRFTAASSSPLWTALLAAIFAAGGRHDAVPLALNLVFALASVIVFGRMLHEQRLSPRLSLALLLFFVVAVPLAPLLWVGMEASLQVLLTLLLLRCSQRLIAAAPRPAGAMITAAAIAALLVATRYEGLFVVAGCGLMLAYNRDWRAALVLIGAAVVPVVIVGVWNLSHGWFLLPASIVMKRSLFLRLDFSAFAPEFVESLRTLNPPAAVVLLALAAASALVTAATERAPLRRRGASGGLVVFLVAVTLHFASGRMGVFYRYEAYLIALGIAALAPYAAGFVALANGERRVAASRWLSLATSAAAAVALFIYGLRGHLMTPQATTNILQQQLQVASFVGEYYDGQPLAMNDIGATSYYTAARVLDLAGLASIEIARLRLSERNAMPFQQLANQTGAADVAIVYESWFPPDTGTDGWQRVATWTIPHNVVCGDASVSFFARPRAVATLRARLRAFAPRLPAAVIIDDAPDV